uniref:Uncharacterized protein n=1 Tax=Rhabditophanes sp. KR3021 TaxID=114890 RepID=A0AC35TU19_9BILA
MANINKKFQLKNNILLIIFTILFILNLGANNVKAQFARPIELRYWKAYENYEHTTGKFLPTQPSTTTITTILTTIKASTIKTKPPTTKRSTIKTTTEDKCRISSDAELEKILRSSGIYSELYMAVDIKSASKNFQDLGAKKFTQPLVEYVCDDACEAHAMYVRRMMEVDIRRADPNLKGKARASVQRQIPSSSRTWWVDNDWRLSDRGKREETTTVAKDEVPSTDDELVLRDLNSGKANGVVGTTIALKCNIDGMDNNPTNGFQLCKTCRAIRHLGRNFFPRVLNEIICSGGGKGGEGTCLRNEKCVQRFIPLKILKNLGLSECPNWQLVTIQLRTCCDCVVQPNSALLRYINT